MDVEFTISYLCTFRSHFVRMSGSGSGAARRARKAKAKAAREAAGDGEQPPVAGQLSFRAQRYDRAQERALCEMSGNVIPTEAMRRPAGNQPSHRAKAKARTSVEACPPTRMTDEAHASVEACEEATSQAIFEAEIQQRNEWCTYFTTRNRHQKCKRAADGLLYHQKNIKKIKYLEIVNEANERNDMRKHDKKVEACPPL